MQPDVSGAYEHATERLAGPDAGVRLAALRELAALAEQRPARRAAVADALCRHLRGPDAPAAAAAAEVLAALARWHPPVPDAGTGTGDGAEDDAVCGPGCADCLDVDLSGAVLADVDFGGCRFGEAGFADVHFRGRCSFEGARFARDALFPRAVFARDARFAGAWFGGAAVFGRSRFRAGADFSGARFQDIAWFGRGEETLPEDEEVWEQVEGWRPVPWDEPGADDPRWPLAVLDCDYQGWEEGGDGAWCDGPVSFAGARFAAAAWFWKARFGGTADFRRAVFGGRVHLVQPAADLAGAVVAATAGAEERDWPLGWTEAPAGAGPENGEPVPAGAGDGNRACLVTDGSVAPYRRQLAHPDAGVRLAGVRALGELGDARAASRQPAADALCAYLRSPLPRAADTGPVSLDDGERAVRHAAQRLLADRTRPGTGGTYWEDLRLHLSGAVLTDLDLSGCRLAYGDFTGTQFHGTTTFADASFGTGPYAAGADFCLPGSTCGRARFHGRADFTGAALGRAWGLEHCLAPSGQAPTAGPDPDPDSAPRSS